MGEGGEGGEEGGCFLGGEGLEEGGEGGFDCFDEVLADVDV